MSYQVIARKWRPQTFEEVTGQEAITRTLRNALEFDRLHHAYLFSGARGVGKTTTARLLAKALNCQSSDKPTVSPCGVCASCKEIAAGNSLDVLEFDAASNTQVDKIRDLIIENISISPARDRYKIFIIDEVHMLSSSSFNALLKTLEEPPPRVVFIMATTELHKLPDTILSRIQQFEFRTISLQKIFDRLKLIAESEKIQISDAALREIARAGEGSMRDAQSAFDQVISFSGEKIEIDDVTAALGIASTELLLKVMNAVAEQNPKDVLLVVDELVSRGQDLRNFCRDLLTHIRDLLVFKAAQDAENLLDTASISREELKNLAQKFSESDLIRFFHSLTDTEEKIKNANQPRHQLEIGLVKLTEMKRVAPFEKILERLAQLEKAVSEGNFSPVPQEKKTSELNSAPNAPAFMPKTAQTPTTAPFTSENFGNTLSTAPVFDEPKFTPPSFESSPPSFAPPPSFASNAANKGFGTATALDKFSNIDDFDDDLDDDLPPEFTRKFERDGDFTLPKISPINTSFAPPKQANFSAVNTNPTSNLSDIRLIFSDLLEQRGLPFIKTGIEQARSVKIENAELIIELPREAAHFQATFENVATAKILREIGREISGNDVRLKIKVAEHSAKVELAPAEADKELEKERLFRLARENESVKSFLKVFRGEIVDVIKIDEDENQPL